MEFKVEVDLSREELSQELKIEIFVMVAKQLIEISRCSPRDAVLELLAAAAVLMIRNAPPGVGVATDIKDLMVDAMLIARELTRPLPRAGFDDHEQAT